MDGGSILEEKVVVVTPEPTPEPSPKGIGQGWSSEIWQINLAEVMTFDSVGIEPYDEKAAEGKKLLVLFFDISNLSESSAYFSNIYFRAYADGNEVVQKIVAAKTIEGRELAIGSIQPHKMKHYYIVYEVDANWKSFEIFYDVGGMHSDKLAHFKFDNSSI